MALGYYICRSKHEFYTTSNCAMNQTQQFTYYKSTLPSGRLPLGITVPHEAFNPSINQSTG